jgi:NADH dehydrogenase (ubiquinone) Fe-S protein 6
MTLVVLAARRAARRALAAAAAAAPPRAGGAAAGAGALAGGARRSAGYKVSADAEWTGRFKTEHRSNAEELIKKQPVIMVDGPIAVCDGGGGSLGHPLEYIQLASHHGDSVPQVCIYCGLRFAQKPHHH